MLLACAATGWLWWRSRTWAEAIGFRSPGGNLTVVTSHRGGVFGVSTNVPFSFEDGRMFESAKVPVEDFDPHAAQIFDPSATWRSAAGFTLASAKGVQVGPNL